jgi:hypothetical protein
MGSITPRKEEAGCQNRVTARLAAQRGGVGRDDRRTGRRWLWFFFFFLGFVPAQGGIRFDVFVGYDSILPAASWYPMVCEVVNDGPGFDAIFEAYTGHFNQDDRRQLALELPTGTLKRFVIPMHVPSMYSSTVDARLLDRRGKVQAERTGIPVRRQNHWQIPLVGALTRTTPVFPEVKSRNISQPLVARLLPQVFPDNPIALQGLNTIYLSSERALELKEPQAQALRVWLFGGGHLVVGIEQRAQVQGTEWLDKILPCALTGSQAVANHAVLQEWLVGERDINGQMFTPLWSSRTYPPQAQTPQAKAAQANRAISDVTNPFTTLAVDEAFESKPLQAATVALRDGQVLVGSEGEPLVISAYRGLGRVTVLTFSPELEPFLSWTNRPYFWAKLSAMPPDLFAGQTVNPPYTGLSMDGVFAAMIETRQVRKLPVGWLLLLLLGYLIVIGPLDRFWLKKINRPMLTWLTFPAYVVFFSLLIYFIGYKLRAGESEWNELHLVDVVGTDRAVDLYGRTYGTIYSPANARYGFASSEPFAALRSEFGSSEGGRGTLEQRGNNFAARIAVPVWTSRLLVCDWWRPDTSPLLVAWATQGSNASLRVENRLDKPCHSLRLMQKGRLYELGNLAAGASGTFALENVSSQPLANFVEQHNSQFQQAINSRRYAFGSDSWSKISNLTNAAAAASFIHQSKASQFLASPGLDLSPVLDRGEAVLLAWTEDFSPITDVNQFKPRRSHRDTLWRVLIPARAQMAN